jgi:hypothetical protein
LLTRAPPTINSQQNTHTASVHQSSSASAKKLAEHYQGQLNDNKDQGISKIDQVISKIEKDIDNLGDSLKKESAKTCIQRITRGDIKSYDLFSGVTLKQLIALFYLAVHDTKKCTVDVEAGKKALFNALYEIQRGYNLSETGVDDNNEKDKPICMSGTFHKLIEFIYPIHQECQMIFMSPATAALKLLIVIKEKILSYLENNNLNEINEENWETVIWPTIKKPVADRLFSEFSELYKNDKNDKAFIALVDSGVFIDTQKLTEAMAASFGSSDIATPGSEQIKLDQSKEVTANLMDNR